MHFDTSTRQRWMRILAHSQPVALASRMSALDLTPDYETPAAGNWPGTDPGTNGRYRGALFRR